MKHAAFLRHRFHQQQLALPDRFPDGFAGRRRNGPRVVSSSTEITLPSGSKVTSLVRLPTFISAS